MPDTSGTSVPPEHRAFAEEAERSLAVDPMPTFEALSKETGVPVETLVHLALVRWASAGAEALMSVEPQALRDLFAARKREDWAGVAGILDWLETGTEVPGTSGTGVGSGPHGPDPATGTEVPGTSGTAEGTEGSDPSSP